MPRKKTAICNKCGKEKLLTKKFFEVDRRRLRGLGPRCRECKNQMGKRYYRQRFPIVKRIRGQRLTAYQKYKRWAEKYPKRAKANKKRQNKYQKKWRKENRALVNATERRYRQRHREHYNLRTQAWRYGLTKSQLEEMVAQQNGCCVICGIKRKLHVDHSHTTGHIRGLLCSSCNRGLGAFKDRVDLLDGAIRYLMEKPDAL